MLALAAALPAVPIWAKLKKGAAEEAHCDVDLECGAPEGHSYFDGVPGSPGVGADGWATAERISKPKKVWAHHHQKPKTDDSPELPGDNIYRSPPLGYPPNTGNHDFVAGDRQPGAYNSPPRRCVSPNCPATIVKVKVGDIVNDQLKPTGTCSYSHCCCKKPGALDESGRAAWVDQIAAKLREASKAVNGLLPSDPWSLVRVDHSATSCEGGACPRLRLREGARLSE